MDRERLMGGHISRLTSRREQEAIRLGERAQNHEVEQRRLQSIREKKAEPFKALSARNQVVLGIVSQLTEHGAHMRLKDDLRNKEVVVIGKHPRTTLTPDHTAVCGVTEIRRPNRRGNYSDDSISAEFAFAIVPTSEVNRFTQYPHNLHTPNQPGVTLFDPEESPTKLSILSVPDNSSALTRGFKLRRLDDEVTQSERNLQMVLEALHDPELNPHLQTQAEPARAH